jgi:hypothetical protein
MTNNIGSFTQIVLLFYSIGDYKNQYIMHFQFSESNDSEFIAIKNSSDQVVNLSGIYRRSN